jgi:hypothetical protein
MRFYLVHPVRWLAIAFIIAAIILQMNMVAHFWQSFGAGDELGGQLLVYIGVVLALIEVVLFPVADILEAEGNRWRAWVARMVFIFLALVTGFIDYGAFSRITAADQGERERARMEYEQQLNIQTDATRRIEELRAQLAERGFDRPSTALAAELEAQTAMKQRYEAMGQMPPTSVVRAIARLESARITAEDIERLTRVRDQAADYIRTRPAESGVHPQFEAIAAIMQGWGVDMDAEAARNNMAFAMMLAFKFIIMFGVWIMLPRVDEMRDWLARTENPRTGFFDGLAGFFGGAGAAQSGQHQDPPPAGGGSLDLDGGAFAGAANGQGGFVPSNDDFGDEVRDMFDDLDRRG